MAHRFDEVIHSKHCTLVGDPRLASLVKKALEPGGPTLMHEELGVRALDLAKAKRTDLLLIDDELMDMSGTELLKRLRSRTELQHLPVIRLSSSSDEVDRIVAFELGADDYVAKPFSSRELALRIGALFRRSGAPSSSPELLRYRELSIDLPAHEVHVSGELIELTPLEFKLLLELVQYCGQVRRREHLLDKVWNQSGETRTRTLDTHVKRLREKLGTVGTLIETVRGVGYRMRAVS